MLGSYRSSSRLVVPYCCFFDGSLFPLFFRNLPFFLAFERGKSKPAPSNSIQIENLTYIGADKNRRPGADKNRRPKMDGGFCQPLQCGEVGI